MGYSQKSICQKERKNTEDGVCYVTELVKCPLKAYLDRIEPQEYDEETLRRFKSGDMIEDGFTALLRQNPDIYVIGTQWRAYYKDEKVEIHGRIDILAQHDDQKIVAHEVKSTKDHPWRDEPYETHVQQLQFYLHATGLQHGEINYISKKAILDGKKQIDSSYPVTQNHETYKFLIQRAHTLITALKYSIPPTPEPNGLCKYCTHNCPTKENQ